MERHNPLVTIIFMTASLCLLAVMIIQLFPLIHEVATNVYDESITVAYIQEFGARGVPILISLAALQYILVVIPAPAVGVLTGLCYGVFWGSLIFIVGSSLGNLFVFVSIRRLRSLISPHIKRKPKKESKRREFLSREQLEKIKRPELLVFFCFLMPGMPQSALTYLFATTKISIRRYMLASIAGSIPPAIVYATLGDHLSEGNFTTSIIIAAILVVVIVITLLFRKKITKKIIEESSV